jgi:LPS-assembly protein
LRFGGERGKERHDRRTGVDAKPDHVAPARTGVRPRRPAERDAVRGRGVRSVHHGSYNDLLRDEALARRAAAKPAPPAPEPDGLGGGGFYLEAKEVIRQEDKHHIEAIGNVVARYEGRTLKADRVDYDTDKGEVVATGHVEIVADDGSAQFADKLSLDKQMNEGFASGFSTRLQGHVQIAATGATRRNRDVTVLDHVIYTPCAICKTNGDGRPPTWSIRAKRVIEDKRRKTLVFHDAVIEVRGQPVFYIPVLAGADPSAERKSGFLLPFITFSGERGFSYQQPYYQVISSSQDITISPQINSKVNPFINIDYRKRFYSGILDVRAGATYDRDFTSGGTKFGPDTARSYILGSGVFRLDPAWIWGFTAERTSDKLLFDKYSIGDAFIDRGLYASDDRRLISQLYTVRQDTWSYLSVAAINVQGLRANDDQSTFPTIAPLIEARIEPSQAILGGRLRLDASGVALTRSQILQPSLALDGGGAASDRPGRLAAHLHLPQRPARRPLPRRAGRSLRRRRPESDTLGRHPRPGVRCVGRDGQLSRGQGHPGGDLDPGAHRRGRHLAQLQDRPSHSQ